MCLKFNLIEVQKQFGILQPKLLLLVPQANNGTSVHLEKNMICT